MLGAHRVHSAVHDAPGMEVECEHRRGDPGRRGDSIVDRLPWSWSGLKPDISNECSAECPVLDLTPLTTGAKRGRMTASLRR